jgi:hypothetical protein
MQQGTWVSAHQPRTIPQDAQTEILAAPFGARAEDKFFARLAAPTLAGRAEDVALREGPNTAH